MTNMVKLFIVKSPIDRAIFTLNFVCARSVSLSTSFVFVNCASISVFNVLFYIPEGYSPLDHCLPTAATFSLYLAFKEISCV